MKQVSGKKYNWVGWTFLLLCVCSFIFGGYKAEAKSVSDEKQIDMEVQVNFGQTVRVNRNADVFITITNTETSFEADLEIALISDEVQKVAYKSEITIPANGTVNFDVAVPIQYSEERVVVRILDEKNNILCTRKQQLTIDTQTSNYFIGILQAESYKVNLLEDDSIKTYFIDEAYMPEDEEGLDTYDVIIKNDGFEKKSEFSEDTTLAKWCNSGGTLIVGVEEEQILKQLGYEDMLEASIKDTNGNLLYKVYQAGDGYIVEWCYQKSILDCIQNKTYIDEIEACILNYISTVKKAEILSEQSDNEGIDIISHIREVGEEYLPDLKKYAVVFAIYLVIAGPVIYFLLKKYKRRILYYVAVPVVSMIFAGGICLCGTNLRVNQALVKYLTIYNYSEQSMTLNQETFFGIIMPTGKSGVFSISSDCRIEQFLDVVQDEEEDVVAEDKDDIVISWKNDESTLIQIAQPSFMKTYLFHTESKETYTEGFTYNLSYKDGTYKGKITNNLGIDLKSVMLIGNYQAIYIGSLKDGESTSIKTKSNQTKLSLYDLTSSDIIQKLDDLVQKKSATPISATSYADAYEYLLQEKCLLFANETYVIGAIDKDSESQAASQTTDKIIDSSGFSMFVYPLSNVDISTEETMTVTDISKYETNISGEYNNQTRETEDKTIIMKYTLPANYEWSSIIYSEEYNEEFESSMRNGFHGKVSFYDNDNNEYVEVFKSKEAGEVENLKEQGFVDDSNTIIVKYTIENRYGIYSTNILPVLSATLEVE